MVWIDYALLSREPGSGHDAPVIGDIHCGTIFLLMKECVAPLAVWRGSFFPIENILASRRLTGSAHDLHGHGVLHVTLQSAWTCTGVRSGLTPPPCVTRVSWMLRRSPLSLHPLTSPSLTEAGRKARSKR